MNILNAPLSGLSWKTEIYWPKNLRGGCFGIHRIYTNQNTTEIKLYFNCFIFNLLQVSLFNANTCLALNADNRLSCHIFFAKLSRFRWSLFTRSYHRQRVVSFSFIRKLKRDSASLTKSFKDKNRQTCFLGGDLHCDKIFIKFKFYCS